MAQFEFVSWLVKWILDKDSFDFDWYHGNSTKSLQKHTVSSESAEQIFLNKDLLVPLGIQVVPTTNEPRFGALGTDFKEESFLYVLRSARAKFGLFQQGQ